MSQKTYINHITKQGETFDLLALKYYHEETLASHIIKENINHAGTIVFSGGNLILIPILTNPVLPKTLPPWRR